MKLSGQGKLELGLVKNVAARWQSLGVPQSDHNWFGFVKVTIFCDKRVSFKKCSYLNSKESNQIRNLG